ncbi:MAG: desulfoferrodoxin family protein [Candidatus Hodarchaeales archaeon]|jgi:superoxide reductase
MGELYQTADWKSEKHVPAIIKVKKKEEFVKVKVAVGKEIPHPNTTEHHIKWIKLIFWPEEKFPVEVGNAQFVAHGESAQGPNTSSIYTEPRAIFILKTEKGGKLIATSFCNIHGFWKDEKDLAMD